MVGAGVRGGVRLTGRCRHRRRGGHARAAAPLPHHAQCLAHSFAALGTGSLAGVDEPWSEPLGDRRAVEGRYLAQLRQTARAVQTSVETRRAERFFPNPVRALWLGVSLLTLVVLIAFL